MPPWFIHFVVFVVGQITCSSLFDHLTPGHDLVTKDYCLHENFNVTCPQGHVMVVASAEYGRMKGGRCANGDYNVGCSVDVLLRFNRICGGRSSCLVPVRSLLDLHPCQKDYMSYLQASHFCIQVNSFVEYGSCKNATKINLNDFKPINSTRIRTSYQPTKEKTSGTFTILLESKIKSSRNVQRYQSKSSSSTSRDWNRTLVSRENQQKRKRSLSRPPTQELPNPKDKLSSDDFTGGRFRCWWQVFVEFGFQTIDVLLLPFGNDSFVASLSSALSLSSLSSLSSKQVQRITEHVDGQQINSFEILLQQQQAGGVPTHDQANYHTNEVFNVSSRMNNLTTPCFTSRYDNNNNNINITLLNNNNNNYKVTTVRETLEICLNEKNPALRRFETTGNELIIGLLNQQPFTNFRLLIAFKAKGCEGMADSPGFWHEKVGNTLFMRCRDTQVSGNLTCVDDIWEGETLNCSSRGNSTYLFNTDTTSKSQTSGSFAFSHSSVLVAVFFGAGFGVMLGLTLLVSLYCVRRRYVILKRERGDLLVCNGLTNTPVMSCCFGLSSFKRPEISRLQMTNSTACTPASDHEVIMFLGQAEVFTNSDVTESPLNQLTSKHRDSRLCECCEKTPKNLQHPCSSERYLGCLEDLPEILYDHRGPKWKMRKNEGSRTYYSPLVSSLGPQCCSRKHVNEWEFNSPRNPVRITKNSLLESEMNDSQVLMRCTNCTQISKHFHSLGKNTTNNPSGSLKRTSSTTTFSNFNEQPRETKEILTTGEWNKNIIVPGDPHFQEMCAECMEKYLKQRKQCEIPLFVKPLDLRNII